MTEPATIPIDVSHDVAATSNGAGAAADGAPGWRWSEKQQRHYIPRRGRPGVVYREGNETVDEAHVRDAKGPKDKRPKRKPKITKAPAPTKIGLKELELALAEALQAPAVLAAMRGDEWAADHITQTGPVLARNLVVAAEHNPWLRDKLEASLAGDTLIIKLMTMMPVASALVGYFVPLVIYYLDPGFIPVEARDMFRIPDRQAREEEAADAASTPVQGAPHAGAQAA